MYYVNCKNLEHTCCASRTRSKSVLSGVCKVDRQWTTSLFDLDFC